ncbi:MAG: SCP2 sterol-binding domain-containing protein [Melioribacter sp.]|nr:SCP2 sterol-binding domain-containing protein [Melioribacter sp.]
MKFFSPEWAAELKNQINLNQEYKNSSGGWDWLLILSIKDRQDNQSLLLDLNNGECRGIKTANQDDINKCHFIISAGKETWKKILTGSLSAMQAMMMKSLTIDKGNMSELLPYVNSLKELLNSATRVQTEFI